MASTPFHPPGDGLTLGELAALCQARLSAETGADRMIRSIATLGDAGPDSVAFFDNTRYAEALRATRAGAVFVAERHATFVPPDAVALWVKDVHLAFTRAGQALYPDARSPSALSGERGVSPRAEIHPSARLEDEVVVEPFAVIGPDVEIGSGTIVGPGAAIGPGCRIGRDCRIGANATVQSAFIGNGVILHPGVRIGQDGFGYAGAREGILKTVQIGRVIIQDDVEIGANSTVDRGAMRDTVIGENTKIDNQVQVAHNVMIGRNCLIVSQVGISGSVTLGDGVMVGGQSGFNNHVTVGDGAQIAAVSTVAGDVPPGARWGGTPAKPVKEWFKEMALLSTLAKKRSARPGDE